MDDLGQTHSIVIVGGGFAGTALARALAAQRTRGLQVTLVSDESTTTFNPMLPEAVGASVFPEQVVAPLREMLDLKRGDCFVMGRVTDVDLRARSLQCHTLAGDLRLHYDQLVLAFHNRPQYLGSAWHGLLALSLDGEVLAANERACDLLEIRREALVGRRSSDLIGERSPLFIARLLQGGVSSVQTAKGEFFFRALQVPRHASIGGAAPAARATRAVAPSRDSIIRCNMSSPPLTDRRDRRKGAVSPSNVEIVCREGAAASSCAAGTFGRRLTNRCCKVASPLGSPCCRSGLGGRRLRPVSGWLLLALALAWCPAPASAFAAELNLLDDTSVGA